MKAVSGKETAFFMLIGKVILSYLLQTGYC